jgi:hypothetical protein
MAGEESLERLCVASAGEGQQLPGRLDGRLGCGRDVGSLFGLRVVDYRIPPPT